jgi:maleylacetoacetate isomerase
MTVLYDYWRSSAAYRVRIALSLIGESWTSVPVDLLEGAQQDTDYLARNPQGLVPTLEIDGMTLTQSLAILEYLNETRGAGLLPADAAGRARVRALSYAVAIDIHPVCNMRVARLATSPTRGAMSTEHWMQAVMAPGLAALERMVDHPATGRYCHGDSVTMADICLVPQLYNARRWGVDLRRVPRLCRIGDTLDTSLAFAAAHPDRWAST